MAFIKIFRILSYAFFAALLMTGAVSAEGTAMFENAEKWGAVNSPDHAVPEDNAEGAEPNQGGTEEASMEDEAEADNRAEEVKQDNGTAGGAPDRGKQEAVPAKAEPLMLTPIYVRELTEIERGHNDSNPAWSLSGAMLAFERTVMDMKEIIIALTDGSILHKIYYRQSTDNSGFDFFMPGLIEDVSYNAGISWSPSGKRFVFMSNGGTGNYDLYLGELNSDTTSRLTEHAEKDGQAHWSPVSEDILFISGREGKADVYHMDLTTGNVKRLTQGEKSYLYPRWSPDGKRIAMIYGSNENHDIYLIDDLSRPFKSFRPLTTWTYDDLRPVWSPDGKRIAFYSNYNEYDDPKIWAIVVIAADGSDPKEGQELALKVAASDIIPDMERGPAWMPDSRRLVYVKNSGQEYNPIYIVDIDEKKHFRLKTDTRINHDVSCSVNGTIAFRAQVEQWDHIFITKLRE